MIVLSQEYHHFNTGRALSNNRDIVLHVFTSPNRLNAMTWLMDSRRRFSP